MYLCVKKPQPATRTLLVVWVVVVLAASVAAKNNSSEVKAEPGNYAGVDACKTCHQEVYEKNFERTPHFKTTLGDGHGCESCHGPGAAHVAGGGDITKIVSFKKLSRQESNTRCLSSHGKKHEHRHFAGSAHASNNVGCMDATPRTMQLKGNFCL